MTRWFYFGLVFGGVVGLFLIVFLFLLLRPAPPPAAQPAALTADLTIFLSERSLSRLATEALEQPTVIDCRPDGQVEAVTRVEVAGFNPVVHLGLSLERQESEAVSQLRWAQMAFVKIPADWLPPDVVELGRLPGRRITQQMPAGFSLAGVTTTADGINIQLNWE